jgi:hypothetical protein
MLLLVSAINKEVPRRTVGRTCAVLSDALTDAKEPEGGPAAHPSARNDIPQRPTLRANPTSTVPVTVSIMSNRLPLGAMKRSKVNPDGLNVNVPVQSWLIA